MFYNGDCGLGKFRHQFKGRVRVVKIIEGEFLALKLCRAHNARTVRAVCINSRLLMRVFAITQDIKPRGGDRDRGRKNFSSLLRKPGRHGRIIRRGCGIGFARQFFTLVKRCAALR